ncbi:MAG: endonuclease/exonuclease/phosphatase family protein [Bacteroidetes bacterium]|nr:endonuclease/exonuclease/phosphatase family protein [Bacteroidota bacterium]
MKKILFLILLFFAVESGAQDLNVMTYNVRLNVSSDSLNAWPYRKDKLASVILFHDVTILGVQEALPDQMEDLRQRLPKYKSVGVGREDGKNKGEFSAIFYDTTKLQLLQSETFWLSETPTVAGSIGWDAAITRIVTWAKFKDKKSKKIFFHFNTHFDHMGELARRESAKMALQKVKEIAGVMPVVFTGDFNSRPTDEPIQIITDKNNPLHLTDSKEISVTPHYGLTGTFNAFQSKERDDDPIDYIFLKGKWKVWKHATLSGTWNGRFASDHFAVFAKISL